MTSTRNLQRNADKADLLHQPSDQDSRLLLPCQESLQSLLPTNLLLHLMRIKTKVKTTSTN